MTDQLKIKINDKEYAANPGDMILDVVRRHDVDTIPTLCHDPKLPPYGSCYLCVVEIEGLEKLVPSCSSPVAPGMAIHTDNERIRESRKTALELLLSNHYADCLGPCTQTCPAGVDVQGYIALMSVGRHRDAVRLIKEVNPLPLVCGRVCVRECETACRRNLVDDRVGIDYLKRYATDIDISDPWTPELPPRNGKKVAIVGGGPAGLTAAYFLTLKGYGTTIFEGSPKCGGMLRYGIPEYRLPKALLDREIAWITDLGVEVKTGARWGEDFSLESLKHAGFDAIFLAIGAQKAKTMGIADEEKTEGIIGGVDFLRAMQTDNPPGIHGTVVVVGGGNTAVDAARTSLRIGAEKVIILYRRTMKEMPAHQMEVDAAAEEGVEMIFLSAPLSIVSKNGRLEALRCIRMELGAPDASGRRSPVPVEGSEYDLPCQFVISAIGQDIDLGKAGKESGLSITRQKAIVVERPSFATSIPGVFAGGDAVTGPAVAIDAIAHGRAAALAIDEYIREGRTAADVKEFLSRKDAFGEIPESEFADVARIEKEKMAELPPKERIKSQVEVEVGFTEAQVACETGRCLECGCLAYFDCGLRKYATQFGVDIAKFAGDTRKYKVDTSHPFITLDPNKCINCGRCVRTCSEILRISALGFVYRGFKSIVKPSMEKRLLQTTCISCGNCIAACPTGAIMEKLPFHKPGPWKFDDKESICTFCSIGCNLGYRVFGDDLFTVSNVNGTSHNKGYLCAKGRFGYRYMMDEKRVLTPMIRRRGQWQEASWDEALTYAATRLNAVIASSGASSVAAFASPKLTNEELYLLEKFVRAGLKSNNIGSFTNLVNGTEQNALDDMFGLTVSTATMDDLREADVILVLNSDPSEENPVAELKIKAALKKGAKVVTVTSSEIPLVKFSDLWIDSKRGTNAALVNGICQALIEKGLEDASFIQERTEGFDAFKAHVGQFDAGLVAEITGVRRDKLDSLFDLLANREARVVVVYGIDSWWEKSKNDLRALGNLMMLSGRLGKPGSGIILLRDFANAQGLFDMGVDPAYLPGHVRAHDAARIAGLGKLWGVNLEEIFKPVNLKDALEKDRIKGLLVFGEDPLFATSNLKLTSAAEFMVVVDYFMTATAMEADVFLPASLPIETEGTFTAADRRVQRLPRVFASRTGKENWEIIKGLAEKMGIALTPLSTDDIGKEITQAFPAYGMLAPEGFWGENLLAKTFMTPNGKGRFAVFDIDVTPASGEKRHFLSGENYFISQVRSKLMA
ncbi:MAG: molybdopterin-dependent oxidoreductase [Syntrophorhabdales bacterium]|jgi:formate dehydrogenase major subunit